MNKKYSTTRLLTREKPNLGNCSDDKFETVLFLPKSSERQGEGGLRKKGYFKKSYNEKPLISIITAVYNGEKFLEQTIQNIVNQTYPNIEYIIIDGGSTDKTCEIIKRYEHLIDYWVSEPDNGISDAFNKGVQLARGEYINFQGDGDGFCNSMVIEELFANVNPQKDMFVSGRIKRVSVEGDELFISKSIKQFRKQSLLLRMSLPHQGLFTHIDYFRKYGLFDTNITFSMDYEHLLRGYKEFPKVITSDVVVAQWRDDGLGNGRTLDIYREYDQIKRMHKVAPIVVLALIKYWILLKYYVKKVINPQ